MEESALPGDPRPLRRPDRLVGSALSPGMTEAAAGPAHTPQADPRQQKTPHMLGDSQEGNPQNPELHEHVMHVAVSSVETA